MMAQIIKRGIFSNMPSHFSKEKLETKTSLKSERELNKNVKQKWRVASEITAIQRRKPLKTNSKSKVSKL